MDFHTSVGRVFSVIDRLKKPCVAFTKKLVQIPTVNPPGAHYEDISDVLADKCRSLGLAVRRVVIPKEYLTREGVSGGSPRIAIVADWNNHGDKTLHFNGHYDVVPAKDKEWSVAPFKAVARGGKIYGRGAEDMKATIAAMVYAVEAVKKVVARPAINVELSFTPDEEIGGRTGLKYLVDTKRVRATWAIGEGYGGAWIAAANKGVLWAIVSVKGKAAHASQPYKGVNAFEGAVALAQDFINLGRRIHARRTPLATKEKKDVHPTLVVGGSLQGGNKLNVVPSEVSFSIDRRVLPEETIVQAQKELEEVVRCFARRHPRYKVHIDFAARERAVITQPAGMFVDIFKKSVSKVMRTRGRYALMSGGTDLRYFMYKGVPSFGY